MPFEIKLIRFLYLSSAVIVAVVLKMFLASGPAGVAEPQQVPIVALPVPKPAEYPPMFSPEVLLREGAKATSVAHKAEAATPFSLAATRYGLPVGTVEIVMEGGTRTATVRPDSWSVDADGLIRKTDRTSEALTWLALVLAAALAIGFLVTWAARAAGEGARWTAGLAFGAIFLGSVGGSGLAAALPGTEGMVLLALVAIPLSSGTRTFVMLVGLSVCALSAASGIGIVSPHPALSHLYGTFGLMGWDMVRSAGLGLCGMAAALLLWPALLRRRR